METNKLQHYTSFSEKIFEFNHEPIFEIVRLGKHSHSTK